MSSEETIRAWGVCTDCGYEGVLEYHRIAGEDYTPEALGVVLLVHCPACETRVHTLLPIEYFQELIGEEEA